MDVDIDMKYGNVDSGMGSTLNIINIVYNNINFNNDNESISIPEAPETHSQYNHLSECY